MNLKLKFSSGSKQGSSFAPVFLSQCFYSCGQGGKIRVTIPVLDGRNFVIRVIVQKLLTRSAMESHEILKSQFWFQSDTLAISTNAK